MVETLSNNLLSKAQSLTALNRAILADGPSVYYPMDNAAGPVIDLAGNVNGTASLAIRGGDGLAAKSRRSITFNPLSPSKISIHGYAGFLADAFDGFTLEGWIDVPAAAQYMLLAMTSNTVGDQSALFVFFQGTTDKFGFLYRDAAGKRYRADATSAMSVANNGPHHLAIITDPDLQTATMMLDGSSVATTNTLTENPARGSVGDLAAIGINFATSGSPFNGGMDELAIFESQLTTDQVAAHYGAAT